ncbi:MAG: hypothetical protein WBA97_36640 [Actinophytocola sp.]
MSGLDAACRRIAQRSAVALGGDVPNALTPWAGNLDIMTAAAARAGELMA